ncbi:MAG: response regulator [Bacteroidota bacterium]
MSKLRIGIVEDEMIIADTIILMLEDLQYEVLWHAAKYGEAVNFLDNEQPDLLLLDIQLSGKLDGIDLARLVQEQYNIPYIFITANADAATIERAKMVRPMAYLTKPVTKGLLFSAIEIALSNYNQSKPLPPSANSTPSPIRDAIFVKEAQGYRKVYYANILYLQSDGNYVHLKLNDGKQVLVRSTLPDLLEQIDPTIFVRIHRSYAVNTRQVERLLTDEVVVAGHSLPLGKTYKELLHAALGISG